MPQQECRAAGVYRSVNLLARLNRVVGRESNGGEKLTTALGNMWRVSEREKKKRKKESFQVCGQLFHLAPSKMWSGREGEGENGGGGGGGGLGVCGLCFCYEHLCNGNKLNFKPQAFEERHLVPALTLHQLNLFTAGAPSFFFLSEQHS